jgi:cell division protease FtsH
MPEQNPKKNSNLIRTWLPYILMVGVMIFLIFFLSKSSSTTESLLLTKDQLVLKINQSADSSKELCIIDQDKVKEGDEVPASLTCKVTDFKVKVKEQNSKTTFSGSFKESKDGISFTNYTFTLEIFSSDTNGINDIMNALNTTGTHYEIVDPNANSVWINILIALLPTVLLIIGVVVVFKLVNRANQDNQKSGMDFGKAPAKEKNNSTVKFTDVAGCDEEKQELVEIVDYLKSPGKFTEMGARIPRGVLLKGRPGTGKTLLAKAVAGEAGVPFFYISGSDFVEMFVGVGASRVRDLFRKAKAKAPSIIFIDEIDAVGRQRGAGLGGGNDEREQTLNQLLIELDGCGENTGVIVIAGTNRPDVLDPALLRPGRFDRQITVSLPDKKGREEILKVHARNKKFKSDVDFGQIAMRTYGFSGAELANALNEAAIIAVRFGHPAIQMEDIDEGIDRVMAGPARKSKKYSEFEKKLVAYHEAGHAVIGLTLKYADVVQKVTIVPRGDAGGYNLIMPEEDTYFSSKTKLLAEIVTYFGGRASEEIFFQDVSTGAHNDIERATYIARLMVTEYGMSELGPIQYERNSSSVFLGRDYASNEKNFSSKTATLIDEEIRKIIDSCYARAKELILEHKTLLINIGDALIRDDTLTKENIDAIYRDYTNLKKITE